MIQAHVAGKIFTGEEWLTDHAIIVGNEIIEDIVSTDSIPLDIDVTRHTKGFLAPGFIDIQIYGAHGSLLSVDPSAETLGKMFDYCRSGGANHFQPTVATNSYQIFYKCIDAVKEYWINGGRGVI